MNVHEFDTFGKFQQICQSEISLAEFTVLTNFSQICQSKISIMDLAIVMKFHHFCYYMHFWTSLATKSDDNILFDLDK